MLNDICNDRFIISATSIQEKKTSGYIVVVHQTLEAAASSRSADGTSMDSGATCVRLVLGPTFLEPSTQITKRR
jgi:hypothetical protein